MPRAKKEPERCKAYDYVAGERCRGKADNYGYCLAHQGVRLRGRLAETSHGIFGKYYSDAEVATLLQLESGRNVRLDMALGVAFLTLQRALATWEEYRNAKGDPPLELVEQQLGRRGSPPGEGEQNGGDLLETYSMRRTRPDLYAIVDRCLGRIGSLIQQQTQVEEVKALEGRLEALLARLEPDDAAALGHRLTGQS